MATVEQRKKSTKGKLGPEQWDDWTAYLRKRTKPTPLTKLIAVKKASPLLWALPLTVTNSPSEDLIVRLQKLKPRSGSGNSEIAAELETWLESAGISKTSPGFALETLAWCHALPGLTNVLPAAPWSLLVDQLVGIASEAATGDATTDPLVQQLLAGELPLSLAYLFPELPACKELATSARDVLSLGLTELLDGEGMPHAKFL